jgi:beta-lactamase regulating signal transducer with metallopeptidase domain
VSVIVAAGGWAIDAALRSLSLPRRLVWAGAMLATVVLVAAAPYLASGDRPGGSTAVQIGTAAPVAARVIAAPSFGDLPGLVQDALDGFVRASSELLSGRIAFLLLASWALLSAGLLAVGLATQRRAARARRRWEIREVAGARVRVSPTAGPAVLGVRHPEVVVPRWLLEESDEARRLVVLHEQEHIRARDPQLLAAGCVLAALLPWSPASWWMLSRLRLAVETDCDRRVLRQGVSTAGYGSLLIRLAGRGSDPFLGLAAPAATPLTLEKRLRAMTTRLPRFAGLRAAGFLALGAAVLVAACETKMPTDAEVQALDASHAAARAGQLGMTDVDYFVDGRPATAAEANAIRPEQIVQVNVSRQDGGRNAIHIVTTAAGDGLKRPAPEGTAIAAPTGSPTLRRTFTGLVVIDGVVSTNEALQALRPDQIESVEVTKNGDGSGYNDPRATNGVIRVITKAAHGN